MIKTISKKEQLAFTLIELMVTVAIIAIIASIAVPSYQKYVIRIAESEAIAQIKVLEIQLEKWKSTRLTYKGFIPSRVSSKTCTPDNGFCYDANNTDMYVPQGSTAANHKYLIKVVDSSNNSLVPSGTGTGLDLSVGRSWKIVAIPNAASSAKDSFKFIVNNDGLQCKTKDPALNFNAAGCDENHYSTEQW